MTDLDLNELLETKNKTIKSNLDDALEKFLNESKADKRGIKKFGYRMSMQIDNQLRNDRLMSADRFAILSYDDIEIYWNKFRDLIAFYNLYFEIVANKQLFMAYMGINNRMYKALEKSADEDIKDLMLSINDSFVGMGFSASENGNADSKATKMRLEAKDVGHDVVSAKEEMIINGGIVRTAIELEKETNLILGLDKKLLK